MSTKNDRSDLYSILLDTMIPQAISTGVSRMLLPLPRWTPGMNLPDGMTAHRVALRGKRTKVHGPRHYGATSLIDSVWRKDELHTSRAPVLCFIVKGPVVYQIFDYVLHCETGHSILIPPGVANADGTQHFLDETKIHDGHCTLIQMQPYHGGLYFWQTHFWLDAQENFKHRGQVLSIPNSQASDYLYRLQEEMEQRRLCWEITCSGLLQALLGTLHREIQDYPVFEGVEDLPQNSRRPRHSLPQIEEYIQQHLAKKITTDTMAYRVAMSRTAFTQLFRARTGQSLVEYLTDLRLEKARELLAKSDMAIKQIAGAVGLSPDRLQVLFRQHEGVPPSQYREKHRKDASKRG